MSDMELIMDLYKNPHNKGKIKHADICNKEKNPSCGDEIEITVKLKNGKIADIKFNGYGCAISQAAASLATDAVKGKSLDWALHIDKKTMMDLLGIEIAPLRVKCAMLGLRVLQRGILQHKGLKKDEIVLSDIG